MNACRKKPAAPLHPIPVPKKKWSLVGMDIIGPLQVTDRGNQYIVALTDHFTKFPVAKAIPCKSSEEVARFMYETICIFGAFDSLITDQGREFINFALDILTDRFNINHRISSAYHPETNGQRERDNRTLKDTLVKITDNDDWDELLPAALFAYRTSVHKSTQFSPFLALYGEQAKLPFDVTGDANEQDLNEEIMDTMKGIHEEVKNKIGENISRAQKKQKEYYDSRRAYDHGFRIGDKVLIINAARVHRMGGKMAPRFVGPYEKLESSHQNDENNPEASPSPNRREENAGTACLEDWASEIMDIESESTRASDNDENLDKANNQVPLNVKEAEVGTAAAAKTSGIEEELTFYPTAVADDHSVPTLLVEVGNDLANRAAEDNSLYEDEGNLSDEVPALGTIQPLPTSVSSRPLRVGLSRKQKVRRLHKNVQ
nr:hypothetical protein BaRGS_008143 [Batillaria attramentaria]